MSSDEKRRKEEKPLLTNEIAAQVAKELFGVNSKSIKQLDSYDDCNFHFQTEDDKEFTLKIHNGVETDNSEFLEGSNLLLHHLKQHQVRAPAPVGDAQNNFLPLHNLPVKNGTTRPLAVRLLTWIPGPLMCDVVVSPALHFKAGKYLSALSTALDSFDHRGFHRPHLWDIRNLLEIRRFTECIKDEPDKVELVNFVLNKFTQIVLPLTPKLRSGIIMGDFNDSNIIFDESGSEVRGVIDFGDSVFSWRVADVAIAMAYAAVTVMTPHNKFTGYESPNRAAQACEQVIAGFLSDYSLTQEELAVVDILCVGRLVTSGVIGWFSFSQNPTNLYLKKHSEPAWRALAFLVEQIKQSGGQGGSIFV